MSHAANHRLCGQDSRAATNGGPRTNQGGGWFVEPKKLGSQVDTKRQRTCHHNYIGSKAIEANSGNLLQGDFESVKDNPETQEASLGELDSCSQQGLVLAIGVTRVTIGHAQNGGPEEW